MQFKTTPKQLKRLEAIEQILFISAVCLGKAARIAEYDQGMFDLLNMYLKAPNVEEADAILDDIKNSIKDHNK